MNIFRVIRWPLESIKEVDQRTGIFKIQGENRADQGEEHNGKHVWKWFYLYTLCFLFVCFGFFYWSEVSFSSAIKLKVPY